MRNDVKKAVQAVKEHDKEFNAIKAHETGAYIVLYDSEPGIPPYIVDKETMDVHQVIIGVKRDMDIAFVKAVFVEDIG